MFSTSIFACPCLPQMALRYEGPLIRRPPCLPSVWGCSSHTEDVSVAGLARSEHVLQQQHLGAIREHWPLWPAAPPGDPDWLEPHLPNGLAGCHQSGTSGGRRVAGGRVGGWGWSGGGASPSPVGVSLCPRVCYTRREMDQVYESVTQFTLSTSPHSLLYLLHGAQSEFCSTERCQKTVKSIKLEFILIIVVQNKDIKMSKKRSNDNITGCYSKTY